MASIVKYRCDVTGKVNAGEVKHYTLTIFNETGGPELVTVEFDANQLGLDRLVAMLSRALHKEVTRCDSGAVEPGNAPN